MRAAASVILAFLLAAPAGAAELAVTLVNAAGAPIGNAVVMVRPDAGARTRGAPGPYVMAQRDMEFSPYVLIVPVGAEVSFPNLDPFHHHVYSFSKAKTFELKLYGKDETRRVRFDRPGVVGIGCNIHDDMSAFIRVVDTPYAVKSAASGQAVLRDLPAGAATVTVWHPHLKAAGGEQNRRVTLPASGTLRISIAAEVRSPRLRRGAY
jgi:plastocyanin